MTASSASPSRSFPTNFHAMPAAAAAASLDRPAGRKTSPILERCNDYPLSRSASAARSSCGVRSATLSLSSDSRSCGNPSCAPCVRMNRRFLLRFGSRRKAGGDSVKGTFDSSGLAFGFPYRAIPELRPAHRRRCRAGRSPRLLRPQRAPVFRRSSRPPGRRSYSTTSHRNCRCHRHTHFPKYQAD